METTFTAKEINIMTITIGLRADKVSKEGNFVAERNYYYCVDASWKENSLTSGSETLKCIKGLIKKGLMQEKKRTETAAIFCAMNYQMLENNFWKRSLHAELQRRNQYVKVYKNNEGI